MKTIISYLKKYWIFATIAPLLMLLEVFMDLMLPAIMADIVDIGIVNQNLNMVLNLGLRMILVTMVAFIGGGGCAITSSFASTGLGADLRHDLYKKVQTLSSKNMDELETGNLIIRLTNDVSQIEEVSLMMLRVMVRAPLQIIGSLVMAIIISRQLSLLFVVFTPLLVIVMVVLIKRAYPLFYRVQSKLDELNIRLQENLAGKRLVKAFVREEYEEDKFKKANEDLTDVNVGASRTVSIMNPAMQILLNGAIIAALWFGAELIDVGVLKIGALIAFTNYLRQLLFSLMMFSNLLMRFSRAQASSVRIQEVLNSVSDIQEDKDPIQNTEFKGKIEFKDVSFSYTHQGNPVLKNITFTVDSGETVALIGATGSGKTSLAELIPRFYDLDSGEILIDGKNIRHMALDNLRNQIAFVFQKTILFSGTVMDNILYHYDSSDRQDLVPLMKDSAKDANIDGFLDQLPHGYETDINQKGVNLSGGQKQRIAIARALAKEAPILVFDDATSAVDTATEKGIRNSLRERGSGKTVLIIAQRISSVMDADKIIVLDDGEISGMGTHEELLVKNSLYQEIYYSQIDKEAVS
ncbi:ABC transporter ATP-binding protein [Oceanispirochaeta crateris]|uniref:ABC transporter ATP-binding protein n=1 Tax=Oceanispirochaeta crateris TaxID=2518645 RepID=A0A5C1QJ27_9SPIO|nr:ABC transporter ATP-binding protein [Oceanispirochaeta crateris]QEN06574.1 ABC transporter ATP-binding protein [Oceanispirochaeta crateris]